MSHGRNAIFSKATELRNSPLHEASKYGRANVVEILLEYGASVFQMNNLGNTAMHIASENGYFGIVDYLLEHKAKINSLNYVRDTPLHLASKNGHVEVVKQLLLKGAKSNMKNNRGLTAIHFIKRLNFGSLSSIRISNRDHLNLRNDMISKKDRILRERKIRAKFTEKRENKCMNKVSNNSKIGFAFISRHIINRNSSGGKSSYSSSRNQEKINKLIAENDQLRERKHIQENGKDDMCVICNDRKIDSIFVPCGHAIACLEDGERLKQCPSCRRVIKSCIKIFGR